MFEAFQKYSLMKKYKSHLAMLQFEQLDSQLRILANSLTAAR